MLSDEGGAGAGDGVLPGKSQSPPAKISADDELPPAVAAGAGAGTELPGKDQSPPANIPAEDLADPSEVGAGDGVPPNEKSSAEENRFIFWQSQRESWRVTHLPNTCG